MRSWKELLEDRRAQITRSKLEVSWQHLRESTNLHRLRRRVVQLYETYIRELMGNTEAKRVETGTQYVDVANFRTLQIYAHLSFDGAFTFSVMHDDAG